MSALLDNLKIRDNFDWWWTELASMLPNMRIQSGGNAQAFSIDLNAKGYNLNWHEANKIVNSQSTFSSDDASTIFKNTVNENKNLSVQSCELRIASDLILTKEISLPLATEENIENVIAYEIDRYTPFKKEDVYFSIQIKERDKKEKKISVLLKVIRKKLLNEVLEFAKACELSIEHVCSIETNERIYFVGLLENQQQSKKKNSINKILLVMIAVLLITALVLPVGKNYWIGMQLHEQLIAKDGDIAEVKALLAEYKHIKSNAELVERLSLDNIKVVKLLNDLTEIIPDDTSLNRFSLEEGSVRIQGLSAEASKLIPLLDSSDDFSEVRFVAPVTQSSDTNKEKFTIEIKLQKSGDNYAEE